MTSASVTLPSGFEALQPFVDEWDILDETGRVNKRLSSGLDELKLFYEAGAPLFRDLMVHLEKRPVGPLNPADGALFKLALGLIEISFTFEHPPWGKSHNDPHEMRRIRDASARAPILGNVRPSCFRRIT